MHKTKGKKIMGGASKMSDYKPKKGSKKTKKGY